MSVPAPNVIVGGLSYLGKKANRLDEREAGLIVFDELNPLQLTYVHLQAPVAGLTELLSTSDQAMKRSQRRRGQ